MVGGKNSAIKVVVMPENPSALDADLHRLATAFPPTVIVRDRRENPKKCTIVPLSGRPDLVFLSYPTNLQSPNGTDFKSVAPINLNGYIRLAPEGPELSSADSGLGLLLLDGSWRRAEAMTRAYQHIPPRSLTGFKTAYPRISKKGTDPSNGLATVEALFLAYQILGRSTAGLLDHYRWAEEFLRLNNLW